MITQPVKVAVYDEGVSQGAVGEIDFVGSTVAVAVSGNRATVTVTAGAGGDIAQSLLAPSVDETIAAGSGAYLPDYYEIASGKYLEIGDGAVMEVG